MNDQQAPCPRCRHANPSKNRFCGSCGASLRVSSDLMTRRQGNPIATGRALPAKLKPAGSAVAVGLAALALRAGMSWLRYKNTTKDRPSTSTARGSYMVLSESLLARRLEAVLVEESKGYPQSRTFAWRAIRSIVIMGPIDGRHRS